MKIVKAIETVQRYRTFFTLVTEDGEKRRTQRLTREEVEWLWAASITAQRVYRKTGTKSYTYKAVK